MTYIEHLDPNSPSNLALDAEADRWDTECPEWRELSLDPEHRETVSYWDTDPHTFPTDDNE